MQNCEVKTTTKMLITADKGGRSRGSDFQAPVMTQEMNQWPAAVVVGRLDINL